MKKIIIRIIGSLCILASLAVFFFPASIQIGGVSRKDFRTVKNRMKDDLDTAENLLTTTIAANSSRSDKFKEDLKDYNLPSTKAKIKKRFNETEDLIDELLNQDTSFNELLSLSIAMPQYIEDTANLLDTELCAELIFDNVDHITNEQLLNTIDSLAEIEYVFWAIIALFVAIALLGITSAVAHSLNRVRFIRYGYLAALLAIVVALCICLPMIPDIIAEGAELPSELEGLSLNITALPFVAVALAIIPVVLDIIFERKKKAITTTVDEVVENG